MGYNINSLPICYSPFLYLTTGATAITSSPLSLQVDPAIVDSVIFGSVAQTSTDACYLPRHAALKAGLKMETPALGINRLCGSGFQSVINGVQEIKDGQASVVVCGGAESMTQAPIAVYGQDFRAGVGLGKHLSS